MTESPGAPIDPSLEAIILQFGRPAYFVKDQSFDTADTPSSSSEVDAVVNGAKAVIDGVIPSVGRVNLRNNRATWAGTGWVVAPNVVVTNRHVARVFGSADGDGFRFQENFDGLKTRAYLDTYREHGSGTESSFRMKKILWIEPDLAGHPDVAFLSIADEDEEDRPQPPPISLMTEDEFDAFEVGKWAAVVGYPAYSIYNNVQDQQRIFSGVFDVKRLQPGFITAKGSDGRLKHDATTLGGNSGSAVLDVVSGKAIGLHFGGLESQSNFAVAAPIIAELLRTRAS